MTRNVIVSSRSRRAAVAAACYSPTSAIDSPDCRIDLDEISRQGASVVKARDLTILGFALAIYDFIFTTQLRLMGELFHRLSGLPLAPLIIWPVDRAGQWLGIGLGDLLLAAAFPLVMRKAFGRPAGVVALLIGCGALVLLLVLPLLGRQPEIFPVMVVLGPLMGLQYWYWRRSHGPERTMRQYLLAEPTENLTDEVQAGVGSASA